MNIDTSNWSIVVIEIADGLQITDTTLHSKQKNIEFCEKYGYKLISFVQGSNPYCEK